jgi:hypothetical protein
MLRSVVQHLDDVGIPYMIVGSLASSAHGIARTTFDADLVISPSSDQLNEFVKRIEPQFYVNLPMVQKAFSTKSMFNIVDLQRGCKADLIFLSDQKFDRAEFARRCQAKIEDMDIWTASAEDTILAKLHWARLGDSQRQYRDAFNVASVQRDLLDRVYLHKWAVELQVEDLLDRIFDEAGLGSQPNEP